MAKIIDWASVFCRPSLHLVYFVHSINIAGCTFYYYNSMVLQWHISNFWSYLGCSIYEGHLKFVDSTYYSKSKLCGGVMTISFSEYLPWQAVHFLKCSTHFSKKCCRPLITSKFLALEFPFHGWKSPKII
jgi:hypothetical protein